MTAAASAAFLVARLGPPASLKGICVCRVAGPWRSRSDAPGGSPLQSAADLASHPALAGQRKKTVLDRLEDFAASGGYMNRRRRDESSPSFVDRRSIGVVSAIRLSRTCLKKIGVELRFTRNRPQQGVLEPFLPTERGATAKAGQLAGAEDFSISARSSRRKLADDPTVSPALWTGRPRPCARFLVDALATCSSGSRHATCPRPAELVAPPRPLRRDLSFFALQGAPTAAVSPRVGLCRDDEAVEERGAWGRFGL